MTYDCRGHGASGLGEPRYSVEQFADDLADLMNELKCERALVAGASMGGCVALAWYGPQAPAQWEERAQKALEGGLQALVDFQVTRWFSDEFRATQPQAVAAGVATFLRNDPRAYAASCRMLGAADLRPALAAVRAVAMAESLHSNIKGSTLNVLQNARHLTPLEKPDEIAAELQRLLK